MERNRVGYEPNSYKVWDVKSEKFVILKDVIADKINFLESKPEMRLQGVIVENFNKTDENDVFENSVGSHKTDNEKQINTNSKNLNDNENKNK